jgi:MoCo/4Fe-4S cofactor protein with predicted Tat translocation signal
MGTLGWYLELEALKHMDFAAIRSRLAGSDGRLYWRSLSELADTPDFRDYLHREFPEQASEWNDPKGRRNFLKLMSASLAAGVGACTRQPGTSFHAAAEDRPGGPFLTPSPWRRGSGVWLRAIWASEHRRVTPSTQPARGYRRSHRPRFWACATDRAQTYLSGESPERVRRHHPRGGQKASGVRAAHLTGRYLAPVSELLATIQDTASPLA